MGNITILLNLSLQFFSIANENEVAGESNIADLIVAYGISIADSTAAVAHILCAVCIGVIHVVPDETGIPTVVGILDISAVSGFPAAAGIFDILAHSPVVGVFAIAGFPACFPSVTDIPMYD